MVFQLKENRLVLLVLLLILLGGGIYYYFKQYRPTHFRQKASQEHQKFLAEYRSLTVGATKLLKTGQKAEVLLRDYAGVFSPEEESNTKILAANLLIPTDHDRAIGLLQEVVQNDKYPLNLRAFAINSLVDDYEINFIPPPSEKKRIFSGGGLEALLTESSGDVNLAVRKLNELSLSLYPNAIANYRISKWYAAEFQKRSLSTEEQNSLRDQIDSYLAAGDKFLSPDSPPSRLGLAYAIKARVLHLAGRATDEIEKFFKLSQEAYSLTPNNALVSIYRVYDDFYYAAFLAKLYGSSRAEDIRALLRLQYEYLKPLKVPPEGTKRLVSFVIAARDSEATNYPAPDFNKQDVQRLKKIYPELGTLIDEFDLAKYQDR